MVRKSDFCIPKLALNGVPFGQMKKTYPCVLVQIYPCTSVNYPPSDFPPARPSLRRSLILTDWTEKFFKAAVS